MDRFYLEKYLTDLIRTQDQIFQQTLGEFLTYFNALDRQVDLGDAYYKDVRFLFAVNHECPAHRLLELKQATQKAVKPFETEEVVPIVHFGSDDWIPTEDGRTQLVLRFYLLEDGCDHERNRQIVASLIEDPEAQERSLPKWLNYRREPNWDWVEEAVLSFYQLHLSRDAEHVASLRHFEAAFWRVVNLACTNFEAEAYEDLLQRFPARFRETLLEIPKAWLDLRKKEHLFMEEDWTTVSRLCSRFCQQVLALGAQTA